MVEEESHELVRRSPARRRVLELIRAQPGISVAEVARFAGLVWTSTASHVEELARVGLVHTVRVGRRRVVFPAGAAHEAPRSTPLAEPSCRRVALALVESSGSRVRDLRDITGMSGRAVHHHLQRLVGAGLAVAVSVGGARTFDATTELRERLGPRANPHE